MAVFLQPIYTQTVGAGGATVVFNNIPGTFTDLKIVVSGRRTTSASELSWQFNSDTGTNYSTTIIYADGSSVGTFRTTNTTYISSYQNSSSNTANTFSNTEIYIPNYAGSNFKSMIVDSVAENNATAVNYLSPNAGLWRSTSAITSINFFVTEAQYTTISIYGILRSGV